MSRHLQYLWSSLVDSILTYLYIALGFIKESPGILILGSDIDDEQWSEETPLEVLRTRLPSVRTISGRAVMGATMSLLMFFVFIVIYFVTLGNETVFFLTWLTASFSLLSFTMSVYYIDCWRKLNGIHSECLDAINLRA
jgi:hypothetical protein